MLTSFSLLHNVCTCLFASLFYRQNITAVHDSVSLKMLTLQQQLAFAGSIDVISITNSRQHFVKTTAYNHGVFIRTANTSRYYILKKINDRGMKFTYGMDFYEAGIMPGELPVAILHP